MRTVHTLIKDKAHSPGRIDAARRRAARPDLLVDVAASRHVKGAPDAHAGAVQRAGSGLRHVTAAVHLLVVDRVLVIVVGLEGELGAADRALEAARVEEREVLQGTHPVDLVDGLSASQTRALVEVGPIHDTRLTKDHLRLLSVLPRHPESRARLLSNPDHRSLQSRSAQCFALDACDLEN